MVDIVTYCRQFHLTESLRNELRHVIHHAIVLAVESRPLEVILHVREDTLNRIEIRAVGLVIDHQYTLLLA